MSICILNLHNIYWKMLFVLFIQICICGYVFDLNRKLNCRTIGKILKFQVLLEYNRLFLNLSKKSKNMGHYNSHFHNSTEYNKFNPEMSSYTEIHTPKYIKVSPYWNNFYLVHFINLYILFKWKYANFLVLIFCHKNSNKKYRNSILYSFAANNNNKYQ